VSSRISLNLQGRRWHHIGSAWVLLVVLLLMPVAAHAADSSEVVQASIDGEQWLLPVAVAATAANAPSSFPSERSEGVFTLTHMLVAGSFVLHGIDLSVSMYRFGQAPDLYYEANPLLRPLQDRPMMFAAAKMGISASINALLLVEQKKTRHPRAIKWAALAQNAVMVYVVIHNERQP
jgi:hypothetical protein